jgi:hypothetical protein
LGTSKQTIEAKQLNSLEESLQAATISKREEDPAVSSTDRQSLIAEKKRLQSEIFSLMRGIDNLKVT